MKAAAFVADGLSLEASLPELKKFAGKVFATPKAVPILEEAGVRAQPLGDPMGVTRIYDFGHREIHLYGFDLCHKDGEGSRVAFEDRVFYITPDQAQHAPMLLSACAALMEKGASIGVHGEGMFPHMARCLMRDMQERVLTAVYDLTVAPPTYEFFSFLAEAERYRMARGFTKIDVVFAPGPIHGFRDDGLPPAPPERVSMLHRICVAGARLLPTVRNVHVMKKRSHLQGEFFPADWTNDRPRFHYGPRFQKFGLQCLEATAAARDEVARRFMQPYATITLREADYWPGRNSDFRAWEGAARELRFAGIQPVIVPDTHGSTRITGQDHFEPAAWDVDLRLALYEGAEMNFGVQNGPMALLMLAKEKPRYTIFQKPDEESATPAAFLEAQGLKEGDQWSDNGRTIWTMDSPEAVREAVREFVKLKEAA